MHTSTITFRLSEDMKDACREILAEYDMSVSDYCRLAFEYLIQTGRPAVQKKVVSDQELQMMRRARTKKPSGAPSSTPTMTPEEARAHFDSLKTSLADFD